MTFNFRQSLYSSFTNGKSNFAKAISALLISIRNVFETVSSNLQNEYRQRTESDKKVALYDMIVQLSHDIRSPLAVIEIILLSYSRLIPEKDINMQREAIQRVRNHFDQLLNHHRKQIKLNKNTDSQPLFFHSIIEQMIDQKKKEWSNKTCQINFSAEPGSQLFCVNAVETEIKIILSNLLNNAYESLQNKKEIHLKLRVSENYLKLHIIDTGTGIAEKNINGVLNGLSLKHEGKGLGLSSAKSVMEGMGGSLELHSILGSGTEVILSFPKTLNPF